MDRLVWLHRCGALSTAGALLLSGAAARSQETQETPQTHSAAVGSPVEGSPPRLEIRQVPNRQGPAGDQPPAGQRRLLSVQVQEEGGEHGPRRDESAAKVRLYDEAQGDVLFFAGEGGVKALTGGLRLDHVKLSEYWIGVECRPVDEVLRAQLALQDAGLVVDQVKPDSPAAKSEIKVYDILLTANDKPLKQVPDFVAVLEESKDKELTFKALRSGKEISLKVTPAKRAEGNAGREGTGIPLVSQLFGDRMPAGPLRLGLVNRGLVVPHGAPPHSELPDDLSVSVRKEGKKPAAIKIKQGDKTWTTSEDKLGELPEDVRVPIESWLGRGPMRKVFTVRVPEPNETVPSVRDPALQGPVVQGGPDIATERRQRVEVEAGAAREAAQDAQRKMQVMARRAAEMNGDATARIEKQLQAMSQRMSEINRELQDLRRSRREGDGPRPETRSRDRGRGDRLSPDRPAPDRGNTDRPTRDRRDSVDDDDDDFDGDEDRE